MHLKRNKKYINTLGITTFFPQTILVIFIRLYYLSVSLLHMGVICLLLTEPKHRSIQHCSIKAIGSWEQRKARDWLDIRFWGYVYPNKTVESTQMSNVMHLVRPLAERQLRKAQKKMNKKNSILSCSGRMSNVNRLSSNNVVQWISWRHKSTLRHFLSLHRTQTVVTVNKIISKQIIDFDSLCRR